MHIKNYRGITSPNGIVGAPVTPNAGIRKAYQKTLDNLIKDMTNSVLYWVKASYRRREDEITTDASPPAELKKILNKLFNRWERKFDEAAEKVAVDVVNRTSVNVASQLKRSVSDAAGVTIKTKNTRALQNVLKAAVVENVGLIRSIPEQYFRQINFLVMQSVSQGRDLEYLTNEIQGRFGVTRKRAAFIAQDQTSKITETISARRQIDIGITRNVWLHSGGGKEQRADHVAAHGTEYEIAKGCPIGGEHIHPGQKPNCRCTSCPVLPLTLIQGGRPNPDTPNYGGKQAA